MIPLTKTKSVATQVQYGKYETLGLRKQVPPVESGWFVRVEVLKHTVEWSFEFKGLLLIIFMTV